MRDSANHKPRAISVYLPKGCALTTDAGPGSIVTMPNGKRYEVRDDGAWIRVGNGKR